MSAIDLLIDFVNVKEWSKAELFNLTVKHRLITSLFGEKNGYEDYVQVRQIAERFCCIGSGEPDPLFLNFLAPEKDFFDALTDLQAHWRAILKHTREQGPDVAFLNEIAMRAEWQLIETANPLSPRVGPFHFRAGTLDEWLEFRYLDAITERGADFLRLRACNNPACEKMFLGNRPKQKFCENSCRHHYHNKIKIESGYLAEHQKKGRGEKPEIYLLK